MIDQFNFASIAYWIIKHFVMKNILSFSTLLLLLFSTSCGEEEGPDFIGTYEEQSLRDECPNTADNAQVTSNQDGICLQEANGVRCIEFSLEIRSDGTYMFTSQITEITGGITFSEAPNTETGTYSTEGYMLTLVSSGGRTETMELDANESSLDWQVPNNQNSCRRLYRLIKRG